MIARGHAHLLRPCRNRHCNGVASRNLPGEYCDAPGCRQPDHQAGATCIFVGCFRTTVDSFHLVGGSCHPYKDFCWRRPCEAKASRHSTFCSDLCRRGTLCQSDECQNFPSSSRNGGMCMGCGLRLKRETEINNLPLLHPVHTIATWTLTSRNLRRSSLPWEAGRGSLE